MKAKTTKRLVREGNLAAEVDVTLVEAEGGWTPYLSLEDAYKLDDVREALRAGVRVVTAYRPDAGEWEEDLKSRRHKQ